jgi:UDP-N-acetylmuramoyl-L-alanyl-D-glutamate--2,6-diaminopimelate ligase
VVGVGRAGAAAASALCDLVGAGLVRVCDSGPARPSASAIEALRARGVEIDVPSDGLRALESTPRPGCVVKSPGIPFSAPVLARAAQLGLPVIDELELGWRLGRAPLVCVTGTSGKSTVCSLLSAIAAAAGAPAPVAGNTEFGPPLSALARSEPEWVVCETSSYQLEGSPSLLPHAALLTNLRPDHLVRHADMEAYAACKRRLFVRGDRGVELGVLNADDGLGRSLAAELSKLGREVVLFGRSAAADFRLRACGWTLTSGWVELETPDGELRLDSRLPGPHNAENVTAALAAARALGFELPAAVSAIARAGGVPGRFERIEEGQPFDVIVDFAHTPDAIEAVLTTVRAIADARRGRVHAVLGDAGHRPKVLRVPLGEAAGRLADRLIVTEGNLKGEPLAASVLPLSRGARAGGRAELELVPRRREAIRHAFATADEPDLVVLLGRGARPRILRTASAGWIPFDDRAVAREELRRLFRPESRRPHSRAATMWA